jgi:CRISPR-associated protein Cas5t
MDTLWLRIQAPFAAFRAFQAGVYRSTAPIMPPSTAFGLVLNLAGIEMRENTDAPITQIRKDLPSLELAIGSVADSTSEVSTLYQQLHSYPVGTSGKDNLKPLTKGAKFWITPVRRELLVGLDMILGVRGNEEVITKALQGLQGEFNLLRYGLPFAGDNNFLFDRIEPIQVQDIPATNWYVRMEDRSAPIPNSCYLTVGIDRLDNSNTSKFLYAPEPEPINIPPPEAWTWTPKQPVLL